MRRHQLQSCLLAMFALAFAAAGTRAETIVKPSPKSVAETVDRLEKAAVGKGMTLFGRIDHGAGATAAGLSLPAMVLVQFGNPKGGTPLMQAEPTMGLSLPLKVLVWQGSDGKVQVAYDPPADLARLRNLASNHPVLEKIGAALDAITSEAIAP
ncbi:MAG: DUF302 domain-containing protein [Hyphomicrobiaceae bacterium]